MHYKFVAALVFTWLALLAAPGCEKPREHSEPVSSSSPPPSPEQQTPEQPAVEPAPPAFENYLELGDLAEIRARGVLRLLAPRGQEDDALPRDGLPGSEWRQLAERFARSRGLEPQWIYVDSFADLIPALVQGRGDVIASNFSRTAEHAEQVAFTRALQYVRELLVTRGETRPHGADAEPLRVAVRRGSAFVQTLSTGEHRDHYAIAYVEEPVDHDELLAAVSRGVYPATVIDSNLADALLPSYPDLQASPELQSQRAIAWAVRREAVRLERALNEFFTAEHLLADWQQQRPLRDWAEIQRSRTLRVLTRNHPASYFMWRGELMGFDYDLLKQFAREHKLRLSMVVPGPDVDLAEALNAGMGDMIAASLTVTESRRAQGLVFSRPYLAVTEQVIAAKRAGQNGQETPVAELLAGQRIAVNPLSSFHARLNGFLKKHHRDLFFNVTYNKYFKETKRIRRHQRERLRTVDQLSPFDPLVRRHAGSADRDWRMVVAQMYQESRFNPRAESFAGARGLMQVLPRTARQMGIDNLFEPENGIRAGVTYLDWLEQRFPRDLPFDQKIYFTLAAYNAGHGHVRDARNLAARLGKDPDRWFGNVEEAMLMLSRPEYYRQARFGYVRGRESVNYVREIRERYLGYLSVARNDH